MRQAIREQMDSPGMDHQSTRPRGADSGILFEINYTRSRIICLNFILRRKTVFLTEFSKQKKEVRRYFIIIFIRTTKIGFGELREQNSI